LGTADPFKILVAFQLVNEQGDVNLSPGIMHTQHAAKQSGMRVIVEVFHAYDQRHVVAYVGFQQDAAQHGHLGLHVVRRLSRKNIRRG
jgi:hypothetical protein